MNNFLDTLQQAWQSQCSKPLDVNPDLSCSRSVRLQRRACISRVDTSSLMLVFAGCGTWMLRSGVSRYSETTGPGFLTWRAPAWVVAGYILFNRWR